MQGLSRGFRALEHRNYKLFFWGQLISLIGTWMQTVAQAWLVLQLTGSAIDLGIVSALQMLPVLFVGVFGGVLADRWRKRDLLVVTQTTQMLLALILAVLVSTHLVQMWHIYILATLLGFSNALDMPTRQAFVMEMVGRDDLVNAVALSSMQFNAARVVGPALAGLSIAAIGVAGSFYANGASFLFVILGLIAMRSDEFFALPEMQRLPVLQSLSEGCSFVWRTPAVLVITVLVGLLGLFAFNLNVLVPIFAKSILNVGAEGYGWLMALMGVGAIIAALAAAFAQRARWSILVGGALFFCIFQLAFAFSRNYPLSLAFLGLSGFGMVLFFTAANTGVQQQVPDLLRGRVMGVYMTVNVGVNPIGNLAAGWLAADIGAPATMILGAVAALLSTIGGCVWLVVHRKSPSLDLDAPLPVMLPSLVAEPAG